MSWTASARALLAAVIVAWAAPGAAQAAWLRAETRHFVVYSEDRESILRAYAVKLEDFDALLRHKHGIQDDGTAPKLSVYIVPHQDRMRIISPGISDRIGGFYRASLGDIFAVAANVREYEDSDEILFHEYVHHFMMQYFPNAYPRWVMEGWAEYFMTAEIGPERITVGKPSAMRAGALNYGWLPIETILGKPADEKKEAESFGDFYTQAWLLTHYMLSDPERERQFYDYLRAVAGGADTIKAMETATGMSNAALQKALREYSRRPLRYGIIPRSRRVEREVTVTALPPSAADLLLLRLRVEGGVPKEQVAEALKTVRAKTARYPGDRLANLVLATAETNYGDRAAGEAILTRMLAADPADADALRLMGLSRAAAADALEEGAEPLYAEARSYLARAEKARPDDYRALFAYATTRAGDAGYPNDNTLNMLMLSGQLAPQVAEIAIETARALMIRGRLAEAANLLGPVANDPHGDEDAIEVAREMLGQIASASVEKIEAAE